METFIQASISNLNVVPVTDLKVLCKQYGIATTGLKEELISRLSSHLKSFETPADSQNVIVSSQDEESMAAAINSAKRHLEASPGRNKKEFRIGTPPKHEKEGLGTSVGSQSLFGSAPAFPAASRE